MADLLRLMDEDQSKQSSIHRQIKVLKEEISELSKRNYELEKDVHFFDQRIGLLINHKKAVEELLDSFTEAERKFEGGKMDGEPQEKYGNLFFLLQTEPYYLAQLTRTVSLSEVDSLLQPVLFSLYGNQYEAREEYLLLCMFELALKYEVDESETFNSLLRANTVITRMMTTYTRRGPGQEYLKSTLSRVLNEVVSEHDLVLEINPVKVFTQIYGLSSGSSGQLTMERAMDDTGVQAKISEHCKKLVDIATQFVVAIKNSLEHVPYGIRLLCCTIVSLVKEKFPQASTSQMTSLIGGFFLLRFLNPAIVTPNAFMLVSQRPSPCVKRNLMLVAKLLQSMANKHYVSSHFKEEYMQTLEPFAVEHVDELHNFLLKLSRLSGISDFYENVELEQYLSLSKEIKINITPNEMYRIHELILKYKEELALTEDDPLHILLDELGPPGKQLSYSMNNTISLTLTNRWEHTKVLRTDSVVLSLNKKFYECSITEQCRTLFVKLLTMDTRLMEEKSLMDVIIRARKEDKGDMSRIAGYIVSKYKHFVEFKSLLTANADFYEEVKQEVKRKMEDFCKHEAMLKNLQGVHETLCKQERFLRDQLAVYKEYLIAVRMKAASPSSKKTSVGLSSVERTTDPLSFTYTQLEKEGIIVQRHEIPEKRKNDLTVTLASSEPGVYQVVIFSKGEPNPVYEIHLNLEELLELQHQQKAVLRLNEMVLLDVRRTLNLLHKNFASSTLGKDRARYGSERVMRPDSASRQGWLTPKLNRYIFT